MPKRFTSYCLLSFVLTPFLMGQSETYTVNKAPFCSDKHAEFSPVIHKNGLVYCTDRDGGLLNYSGSGNKSFIDLYYVDTTSKSNRQKPELFSKALTSKFNDGPVTFNATGDSLFFSRNLLIEGKMNVLSSQWNKLGIFSAVLHNGEWTNIREFRLNSEWYNLTTPCYCKTGNRLYFASDMPNGYGGSDLYYSERKNGYWGDPVNLGPVINTEGNEAYPFFNQSGDFFFSSDGHPGMGGKDIFYSRYINNSWVKPIALEPPVNSAYDDFGIVTDTFMNYGYFSSNREGSLDIYQFQTIFPQVFYKNYLKESNYCYHFKDTNSVDIDPFLLEFVWYFGDGKTAKGTEVAHCYPGPGEYNLHLDVVDKSSGELFFSKLKHLIKISVPVQAYIEAPDLVVAGEETRMSGLNSNLPGYKVLNYTWDFGDSGRARGATVSHSYSTTGEYDISLFLNTRSEKTGNADKALITKKIIVVDNQPEKRKLLAQQAREEQSYADFRDNLNTNNTLVSEKEKNQDDVYCLELLSSKNKLDLKDPVFHRVPDKYFIKERIDDRTRTFSYTIEHKLNLMFLYPAFKEIRGLGFKNAVVKYPLKDPAERELFDLLENYQTSSDIYFDRYDRLTTDAYIMLDQVVKYMIKYPRVRLEISVHTDNAGYATRNLSLSQQRANTIADYLQSRGIEAPRTLAKGYGDTKPIAPNTYELERGMNRRVEFGILP